ncbi:MAG: FtsQ-type POTRA domain-containing protein [Cyanobacteriota bacterium]|nr:FtsQ-type POTRA domain-containing protein [Cyanobacteriota bacterium]
MSQAERRQALRKQRRRERWRQLWRTLVFTATAVGLGYALLRQGWVLGSPEQVEVIGSRQVSRDQVIQAADLRFPTPLLTMQPSRLVRQLSTTLPVDQVQVQRLMAPPRLRVQLVDRRAVARAERQGSGGLERGFVDHLGNWMTTRQQLGVQQDGPLNLWVKGWQVRYRPALALLLSRRSQLSPALQGIRFEPGGSLWLQTTTLGAVRFGPLDARLGRRIDVLEHLLVTLPAELKGRRLQAIDLSDPEQPEISLPAPLKPQTPQSNRP